MTDLSKLVQDMMNSEELDKIVLEKLKNSRELNYVNCFIPLKDTKTVLNQGYKKPIKITVMRAVGQDSISGAWIDLAYETKYSLVTKLIEDNKLIKDLEEKGQVVRVNLSVDRLNLSDNEKEKLLNNEVLTLNKGFKNTSIVDIEEYEEIDYSVNTIIQEYAESLMIKKLEEWAEKTNSKKLDRMEFINNYLSKATYGFKAEPEDTFKLTKIEVNGQNILE